jgi:HlyD family secretion protein
MAVRKLIFPVALAFAVGVAIIVYFYAYSNSNLPSFRLTKVEWGPIISTVSSTGMVTPVTTVQVGSQISGQIKELYVDFNSKVKKGEIIARIDPENFEARVRQADAELAVARANVAIQSATVERMQAELENAYAALTAAKAQTEKARVVLVHAKRDLDRKKALHKQAIISKSQIDDAVAAHDQAYAQVSAAEAEEQAQASMVFSRKAQLKMSQAQVEHALAQVKQRKAALHNSKVDLEHTIIGSPLDGVVIQRNVDIGQTVAASLQAPTLFTIAQDLRHMQVDTNVDEADIGRIQVGQRATFTVDSFPGREFNGQVEQIRKAPQTIQNVVTYTVVVSAENQDQLLLPGMTANVQLVIDERKAVLKVSNAALRFRPSTTKTEKIAETSSVAKGSILHEGSGRQTERLQRLSEMLGLNKDQQTQIRAIFSEQRERIITLRRQGAALDDIRTEAKQMWNQNISAVSSILTPEQRKRFIKLIKSRKENPVTRGGVWVLDKNGIPVPVDIITGISDGSFTEIVRGNLQAGQEVIVGTNQTERKSSASKLGRFGF